MILVVIMDGFDDVFLPIHRTCDLTKLIGISQLDILPYNVGVSGKFLEAINPILDKVVDIYGIGHIFYCGIGQTYYRRLKPIFQILLQASVGLKNGYNYIYVQLSNG